MSEKRFFKAYFTKQIIDKVTDKCYPIRDGESIDELVDLLNEQQDLIDKLQRYNDVLHDENLFNTMKMLEFMKEKGVFDEFYERIKKEVFGDE